MQQGLMILELFLVSNLIAFTVHCVKGKDKQDKIEIMSVRSRIRKIERINKEDKNSLF